MRGALVITAALAGPVGAAHAMNCHGVAMQTPTGTQACVTLTYEKGDKAFTVFVDPDQTPRKAALTLAHEQAAKHCRSTFQGAPSDKYSARQGSWAVPSTWEFKGRCK
jgi:hypothetical protein